MKRLLSAAVALLCALGITHLGYAQMTTVTAAASSLKIGGTAISTGVVMITPVDVNGIAIAFQTGGGGLNSPGAWSCSIATGGLSGCSVPDSCLTTPANLLYNIQVADTSTGTATSGKSYTLQSVVGVCGTTWALDHYGPPAHTTSFQNIQTAHGASSQIPSACTAPAFFTVDDTHALLQCIGGVYIQATSGSGGGASTPATAALLKGSGAANTVIAAVPGTDYLTPTQGVAATAQALATNPAACPTGQYVTDLAANGTLTCSTPAGGSGGATTPATSALLKGTGTANGVAAAVAGTDYVAPSALVPLTGDVSVAAGGGVSTVHSYNGGTSFGSAASHNAGDFVATPSTGCTTGQYASVSSSGVVTCSTPAAGSSSTVPATTDLLKGTGTAGVSAAAIPGTDYAPPAPLNQAASNTCDFGIDSMTEGTAGTAVVSPVTYPSLMHHISQDAGSNGICSSTLNEGVSGQTTQQGVARLTTLTQGITVTGGSLTAIGTPTAITYTSGDEITTTYSTVPVPAFMACGTTTVHGVLTYNSGPYFTPDTSNLGSQFPLACSTSPTITPDRGGIDAGFHFYLGGKNDLGTVGATAVLSNVATTVNYWPCFGLAAGTSCSGGSTAAIASKRFAIFTLPTSNLTGQFTGQSLATVYNSYNSGLIAAYPSNVIDIRAAVGAPVTFSNTATYTFGQPVSYSSSYYIAKQPTVPAGNTPSATSTYWAPWVIPYDVNNAEDMADVANGVIPSSLRIWTYGTLPTAMADLVTCPNVTGLAGNGSVVISGQERINVLSAAGGGTSGGGNCVRGAFGSTATTHGAGDQATQIDPTHPGPKMMEIMAKLGYIFATTPGVDPATDAASISSPTTLQAGVVAGQNPDLGLIQPPDVAVGSIQTGATAGSTKQMGVVGVVQVLNTALNQYGSTPTITCSNGALLTPVMSGTSLSYVIVLGGGMPVPINPAATCTTGTTGSPTTAAIFKITMAPYGAVLNGNTLLPIYGNLTTMPLSAINFCGNFLQNCTSIGNQGNGGGYVPVTGTGLEMDGATLRFRNSGLTGNGAWIGADTTGNGFTISSAGAVDISANNTSMTFGTPSGATSPQPIGNFTTKGLSPVWQAPGSITLTASSPMFTTINAVSASYTITLPTMTALINNLFCVVKSDSTTNTVTVAGNGSSIYVNGTPTAQSNVVLSTQNQMICISARASNYWFQFAGNYVFNGTPTITAGAGATSPTLLTVTGNDQNFTVNLTPSATTTASSTLFTVNYASALPTATPKVVCSPNNVATAALVADYANGTKSANAYSMVNGTTGFSSGVAYSWDCEVGN